MKKGKITLSQEQLKTFTFINRFIDKSFSRQQAAELLGLSTRQITHLKKGVLTSGAESLIHKNTGRKPAHAVSDELKEAVLKIYSAQNCRWSTPPLQRYTAGRFWNLHFLFCPFQYTKE